MNRKTASRADTRLNSKSALFALIGLILSPLAVVHAATPLADSVQFCALFDYEQWRRDHPRPAGKRLAALDVGEPRTVRIIYFLPNDGLSFEQTADEIKAGIRKVQTFYTDQMQAHGYGNKTFRFETDAQGEPLVHRVDGQHPQSHYLRYSTPNEVLAEIDLIFDIEANVYLIFFGSDKGIVLGGRPVGGVGSRWSKNGGFALVPENAIASIALTFFSKTVAHELGHAFGLSHDFRDAGYVMSYGGERIEESLLSACNSGFLAVHTYFNPASPTGEGSSLTIEQETSPTVYTENTISIPLRIKVRDSNRLHQALLLTETKQPHSAAGFFEVKDCRGLVGESQAIVEFDYDGTVPSIRDSDFDSFGIQSLTIQTVNALGDDIFSDVFELVNREIRQPIAVLVDEDGGLIYSVAFSPDGKLLASGGLDSIIRLWDVSSYELVTSLTAHTDQIYSVSFSPDGRLLASGSIDGTFKLWDVSSYELVTSIAAHKGGLYPAVFSPDGKLLASGGLDDYLIKLWDVSSGELVSTFSGHSGTIASAVFSPDGRLLASGSSDGTVKLWDISRGEPIATLMHYEPASGFFSVSFSPDSKRLASGVKSLYPIKLWDVATGKSIATLSGSAPVSFSSNGRLLASRSLVQKDRIILRGSIFESTRVWGGNRVKLWDASSGKLVANLPQVAGTVSMSFSPDGNLLAEGARGGTIVLWDVSDVNQANTRTLTKISGMASRAKPVCNWPSHLWS